MNFIDKLQFSVTGKRS